MDLETGEHLIFEGHPSWRSILGFYLKGLVVAVLCGAIATYNDRGGIRGPANYRALIARRGRMEGFIIFDYAKRYAEATAEMAGWYSEGKLQSREDVVEGLETFPDTFLRLFSGENVGKLVLKV